MLNYILGIFTAVLSIYFYSKELAKDVSELLPESIPPALEKARVTASHAKAKYVSRPDVEAKINHYFNSNNNSSYCIIYGAKGVGNPKSSTTLPLESVPWLRCH